MAHLSRYSNVYQTKLRKGPGTFCITRPSLKHSTSRLVLYLVLDGPYPAFFGSSCLSQSDSITSKHEMHVDAAALVGTDTKGTSGLRYCSKTAH